MAQASTDDFPPPALSPGRGRAKIWIDLENTPHIPFFRPILRELEGRGYSVVLTAREAFQTCEMANRFGLRYTKIGRHYGKNKGMKALGLVIRALQLIPFILRERPALGLNHGSRAQILACNILRIPTVLIMDYEHASTPPLVRPQWEIIPEAIPEDKRHCTDRHRVRKFSGIKEDVYVPDFQPDPSIVEELQLHGRIVVTVRPPATEAHYHNPEAELLFSAFMKRVCAAEGVKAILLPRNKAQREAITAEFPEWFASGRVVIPSSVVDGLNLLWHSDLAVSAGGTMNREAAALGVPAFSIFRGPMGAVDQALVSQGRLVMVGSVDEVHNKIPLVPRKRDGSTGAKGNRSLDDIISHLTSILPLQEAWR